MNFFQCIPCGLQTCILADYVGLSKKSIIVVLLLLHTNINFILGIGWADGKEKIKKKKSFGGYFHSLSLCGCVCVYTPSIYQILVKTNPSTPNNVSPLAGVVESIPWKPHRLFLFSYSCTSAYTTYTTPYKYIHRPTDYMCGVSIQRLYRMKYRNAFIPFSLFTERHSRGSL